MSISRDLLERIVSSSSDCIKVLDLDGKLLFMNAGGLRVMEIDDFSQFEGCPWLDFWEGPHAADAQMSLADARDGKVGQFQGGAPTAKGASKWWDVRVSPIFGAKGNVEFILSVSRDISPSHETQTRTTQYNVQLERRIRDRTAELTLSNDALLEQISQREAAEAQVRQMQKMEAIGQLTGGIAHDFNNMLAVIISGNDLIERRLAKGESVQNLINSVSEAAHRAATLTNRLLAFSRQLPLAPETIDPNKLVGSLSEMVRRTIGEQIHFESVLSGGLWKIHADRSQLENAIINLAVNARDAMPDGGRLTIETQNFHLDDEYALANPDVSPGQYVSFAISDTGTGMSSETMQKAFDPFFTTKPVGKGTGLGLSQVFGFVKQSKGHVKLYSELGKGTTVRLYLPRLYNAEDVVPRVSSSTHAPEGSSKEVILLVEDEARIREITTDALRELGYTVIHAHSALAALRVLQSRKDITLLFTDIVMPDMNGRRLAEEAILLFPDLKVLFTTGYTRNAIVHNGVLDPGVNFIAKPYTLDQLARKIREVLVEHA